MLDESTLDELDRKITSALNEDGRVSNNEMARTFDVSEGTIRYRIRRMITNRHLIVRGEINPDSLPDKELLMLGVNVASTKDICLIAEDVRMMEGVQCVYVTSGRYDLMIEALLDVKFGLMEFLSERLATIEGVVSTESFLVVKSYGKWISEPGLDDIS